MEIINAIKVVELMKARDTLLDMRTECIAKSQCAWSFMVNDRKFPIHAKVKGIFSEAINKAIDIYEAEIEKL